MSGEKIVPDEGKEYRCVDIAVETNADGPFIIMEDADGQRVKGHPSGPAVYEFVSFGDIDDSVKKFGKEFGKEIAMRHVAPGMTTEMVIVAWGEPFHKSSVEDKGSVREYWRFSQNRSIVLEDGVVVRVYQ